MGPVFLERESATGTLGTTHSWKKIVAPYRLQHSSASLGSVASTRGGRRGLSAGATSLQQPDTDKQTSRNVPTATVVDAPRVLLGASRAEQRCLLFFRSTPTTAGDVQQQQHGSGAGLLVQDVLGLGRSKRDPNNQDAESKKVFAAGGKTTE